MKQHPSEFNQKSSFYSPAVSAGKNAMGFPAVSSRELGEGIAAMQMKSPEPVRNPEPQGEGVVQMRLPSEESLTEQNSVSKQDEAANMLALQELMVRVLDHDLSGADRAKIVLPNAGKINFTKALYKEPGADTLALYKLLAASYPKLLYGGSETLVRANDPDAYDAMAKKAVETIFAMLKRNGDFGQVFGTRAQEALKRATQAAEAFLKLANEAGIFLNASGEQEEMGINAHTSPGSAVILRMAGGTFSDSDETVVTLIHEAMHHAHADIKDAGGYPVNQSAFKGKPDAVKVLNAAHYEEIARRELNHNPVGGQFVPVEAAASAPEVKDERTVQEKAETRVRGMVREAWERAQNVHGYFKFAMEQKLHTDPEHFPRLIDWSKTLGLHLHERKVSADEKSSPQPNLLDLLQLESLTKTLGQMIRMPLHEVVPSGDPEVQEDWEFSYLSHLIKEKYDERWLKFSFLERIIPLLAASDPNPQNFVLK